MPNNLEYMNNLYPLLDEIDKKPIVLLANYRTGSSGFVTNLAVKFFRLRFSEPHVSKKNIDDLTTAHLQGVTQFVLKCMPDQLSKYKIYQDILNTKCYTIKLTREDKIAQIASYYIASTTNIWNIWSTSTPTNFDTYVVDIDLSVIKNSMNIILSNDELFSKCNIQFDMELTYESIESTLVNRTLKIKPPDNLDLLKRIIQDMYNEKEFNLGK